MNLDPTSLSLMHWTLKPLAYLLDVTSQNHGPLPGSQAAMQGDFSNEIGWHLYVEIRLTLTLSASEDDASARTFLKTLEVFTRIVDEANKVEGAQILEHQGERLHLFVVGGQDRVRDVLTLVERISSACYHLLPQIAEDHFRGFAAAADWGQTLFVPTLTDGFLGIISLSPSANEPAKILSESSTAPAGTLSIQSKYAALAGFPESNSKWMNIDLRKRLVVRKLDERIQNFSAETHQLLLEIPLRQLLEGSLASISSPVRLQGWFMRADLDGFSASVQAAFDAAARGDDRAISSLLGYFAQVLRQPEMFRAGLEGQPNYSLPWAGDCANFIILPPQHFSYGESRERVPAAIANRWHGTTNLRARSDQSWKQEMNKAKWAVGIAGGDNASGDDGNNGIMLIAPIRAGGKVFPVVAGWGARRSSDAYQQPWVRGTETVLPLVDYRALTKDLREAFEPVREHPSYYKATLLKLESAVEKQKRHTLRPAATLIGAPAIHAPRHFLELR
jgi:hypothetical protein